LGLQGAACLSGLLDTRVCQGNIGPAREAVFQIPKGFTVADQDEFVHGRDTFEDQMFSKDSKMRAAQARGGA
jgi:hypothetical protein